MVCVNMTLSQQAPRGSSHRPAVWGWAVGRAKKHSVMSQDTGGAAHLLPQCPARDVAAAPGQLTHSIHPPLVKLPRAHLHAWGTVSKARGSHVC